MKTTRHNRLHLLALCCPLCTQAFESKPHAYVRRIETLGTPPGTEPPPTRQD